MGFITDGIGEESKRSEWSTSVVGSRHVPSPPLLDDPLPVVDHFLGQPNYPAQGAGGGGRGGKGELRAALLEPCEFVL